VTVDSLVVELFRAQNLAPDRITALAERWDNSPVPNDQQVPAVQNSLLREAPRYWYPDPSYDQCCDDTQLHVPYTAYTFLVAGYVGDVRFGGPTGPGWVLACVESTSDEDNIASMAWGARHLISTQVLAVVRIM